MIGTHGLSLFSAWAFSGHFCCSVESIHSLPLNLKVLELGLKVYLLLTWYRTCMKEVLTDGYSDACLNTFGKWACRFFVNELTLWYLLKFSPIWIVMEVQCNQVIDFVNYCLHLTLSDCGRIASGELASVLFKLQVMPVGS